MTLDGTTYVGIHMAGAMYSTGVTADTVDGGLCDTSPAGWSGRIVICQRGDISFWQKVLNVQTAGGVAAVIYNNEPGDLFGTLDVTGTSVLIGAIRAYRAVLSGWLGGQCRFSPTHCRC